MAFPLVVQSADSTADSSVELRAAPRAEHLVLSRAFSKVASRAVKLAILKAEQMELQKVEQLDGWVVLNVVR